MNTIINSEVFPPPRSIHELGGTTAIPRRLRVSMLDARIDSSTSQALLHRELRACGFELSEQVGDYEIRLKCDDAIKHAEGYRIELAEQTASLFASTAAGFYYAAHTLAQLLRQPGASIATQVILDEPGFGWRGFHLDVSRHFFPLSEILQYVDHLAAMKCNRFHWHLTDDQGWRFPSIKYPRLLDVAAWRTEDDGTRYGGYYTVEDVRKVVQYASDRHIMVVPEIELPGHASAAIAAYPELSCTGNRIKVPTTWGIFDDVYCAGKRSTYEFLETILEEVLALFPGEYIHIGGDECPKSRWLNCPDCLRTMREHGLQTGEQLQHHFVRHFVEWLANRKRRAIGWDEILEGGAIPGSMIMSWRGYEGGIAAARAGLDVVMSPASHCYFDHYQGPRETEPPAFPADLPIERVSSFHPIPPELTEAEARHILGAQGNLWTEYMPTFAQVEYMLFPRAYALMRQLW